MAVFPSIQSESIIQVGDRIRLNAEKSWKTSDVTGLKEISIRPEASGTFQVIASGSSPDWIDETSPELWFLDWQYSIAGSKVATVKITDFDDVEYTATLTIECISAADDKLWSSDADLMSLEPDIMKWTRVGRNSHLDIHREAQKQIIEWLDQQGYVDLNNEKYTKDSIVMVSEVSAWSKYLALYLIFYGRHNAIDDVFMKKSSHYEKLMMKARDRFVLRIDSDGDGELNDGEQIETAGVQLYRR